MSGPQSRLASLVSHILPSSIAPTPEFKTNFHTLSPTFFLPRAADIEPDAPAVYHENAQGKTVERTYRQVADRALGFAHYLKQKGYKRTGILCTNTPAFLEAIYGIGGAGGVNVAINYRLKADDITYIFTHADVDSILVDAEFLPLLKQFRTQKSTSHIPFIVDTDLNGDSQSYTPSSDDPAPHTGSTYDTFDLAVSQGLSHDASHGHHGWSALEQQAANEESVLALAYTSGTTARPKGVEYTHRGAYLAAMGNVIESGLNYHTGRAGYLWTLPMFHAMGWTFPWSVTLVRGTHYCLRRIDYPAIWRLLKQGRITHFNAAPTVNTLLCNDNNAERLPNPVRVTVAASPPTGTLFESMTNLNLHPVHVYGLTETYGPITKGYHMPTWDSLPSSTKYAKMARQGHGSVVSLPARVIKTGDDIPLDRIEDVARDGKEVGEIIFSGNICAKGYYKDVAATQKLFAGGVLHTGDLAIWHEDGAVQIIDRGKDIIISGGENISSLSVESALVGHPRVLECAIVAVADEKWGERPYAFVTVKAKEGEGGVEGGEVKGEEIARWAKENPGISGFMQPRTVEIVRELPKTSTGKVRKNVLREWVKGAKREEV